MIAPVQGGVDSLSFKPFPCLRQQLPVVLELGDQLPAARFLFFKTTAKPAPFAFQLFDSLLERLLQAAGFGGRSAHAAAGHHFDGLKPLKHAVAQILQFVRERSGTSPARTREAAGSRLGRARAGNESLFFIVFDH